MDLLKAARMKIFAERCSGPNCPRRDQFWSKVVRTGEGIEFDGGWYCSSGCFNNVLQQRMPSLFAPHVPEKPKIYRHSVGSILVNRGIITREDLTRALQLQSESDQPRRIGQWLLEMGLVTEEQIVSALAKQWNCPAFPLEQHAAQSATIDIVPVRLLESANAVPAHASGDRGTLHIAFSDRVDHTLLYALSVMLRCQAVACVAKDSTVAQVLEILHRNSLGNATCFETIRDAKEVTRTICSYADELQARGITITRVAGYLWIRFQLSRATRDLLFRLMPAAPDLLADTAPAAISTSARKENSSAADSTKSGTARSENRDTRKDGVAENAKHLK